MYSFEEFQSDVLRIAECDGYEVGYLYGTNIPQVDFGYKKLHGNHFRSLFPRVLADNADVNKLIEEVAPGTFRPCAISEDREADLRKKNAEALTNAVHVR